MKDEYFDSIESITLLPHSFKKVGYIVLILVLPLTFSMAYLLKKVYGPLVYKEFFNEWFLFTVHYLIAIGLSLIVFSKEKQEDEMIHSLRFKSFVYGAYIFVVACLFFPILSNLGNILKGQPLVLKDLGGVGIASLNMLLLCVLIVFRLRIYLEKKRE